jgi:hypothetical protein
MERTQKERMLQKNKILYKWKMFNFSVLSWQEQGPFWWVNDDVRFSTRPTHLGWIFIVLVHWNNSQWLAMSLHSNTLFWLSYRVREYLKFSIRHRTDRMQVSASPTKKLVVLQFVKLLTTKDDKAIFIIWVKLVPDLSLPCFLAP